MKFVREIRGGRVPAGGCLLQAFEADGFHVPGNLRVQLPRRNRLGIEHLANRRFPVTCWLRDEHEFEYIVEPDVFHDFFGHVPMLFTPVFADYMEAYGKGGLKAEGLGSLKWLARLYWYTVEFGLIRTKEGLRSYGAGILSSPSEVDYAIRSPKPRRVGFDLKRIMRSLYRIDAFQETYFVIDDFSHLFEATAQDFTPLYDEMEWLEDLAANADLPEDRLIS